MASTTNNLPFLFLFQVMKELQKLFALMEFGNQKYVDPSALLKKLMDRTGTKPVELGQQEDVSGKARESTTSLTSF